MPPVEVPATRSNNLATCACDRRMVSACPIHLSVSHSVECTFFPMLCLIWQSILKRTTPHIPPPSMQSTWIGGWSVIISWVGGWLHVASIMLCSGGKVCEEFCVWWLGGWVVFSGWVVLGGQVVGWCTVVTWCLAVRGHSELCTGVKNTPHTFSSLFDVNDTPPLTKKVVVEKW